MQITNEQFLELSADIAGAWLEDAYARGDAEFNDIWLKDENGNEYYTEVAQNRFNDILDTVQDMMLDYVEVL